MSSGNSPLHKRSGSRLDSSPRADGQFAKLANLLEHPEWIQDPHFSTNSARVANRARLIPLITAALAEHPTQHWLDRFKGQGFPFAPVNNIRQSFEHPQTQAREMVKEVDHPRAGKVKLVAPAIQYNGQRMEVSGCSHSGSSPRFILMLQPARSVHASASGPGAAYRRSAAGTRLRGQQDCGVAGKERGVIRGQYRRPGRRSFYHSICESSSRRARKAKVRAIADLVSPKSRPRMLLRGAKQKA